MFAFGFIAVGACGWWCWPVGVGGIAGWWRGIGAGTEGVAEGGGGVLMGLEEREREHGWVMKGAYVGRGLFVGKDEGVVEGSKEGRESNEFARGWASTIDISLRGHESCQSGILDHSFVVGTHCDVQFYCVGY